MPPIPHITLDTGDNPQYSIIWLHGLGADGEDFVPIAQEIDLPVAVRYLFPHAPLRPVTINGGYVMRAWYDILQGAGNGNLAESLLRQEDEAGIREAQQTVEALLAQEKARGIPAQRIFLAGFSQGGAVALHTALRQPERLGGIIALSTYLPLAALLEAEGTPAARNTPIFMAHGEEDSVLPLAMGKAASSILRQWGSEVVWHTYPMPHSVCMEEVADIQAWLAGRVGA